MIDMQVEYTSEADRLGRRSYTLLWNDPSGEFRPQPDPRDGDPVGYRRAQCFFCVPFGAALTATEVAS